MRPAGQSETHRTAFSVVQNSFLNLQLLCVAAAPYRFPSDMLQQCAHIRMHISNPNAAKPHAQDAANPHSARDPVTEEASPAQPLLHAKAVCGMLQQMLAAPAGGAYMRKVLREWGPQLHGRQGVKTARLLIRFWNLQAALRSCYQALQGALKKSSRALPQVHLPYAECPFHQTVPRLDVPAAAA